MHQRLFALRNEASGGKFEDKLSVHACVELEVEGVERSCSISKASLLDSPLSESIVTPHEFVTDESRQEVERCH
jgi:hypothetical protein